MTSLSLYLSLYIYIERDTYIYIYIYIYIYTYIPPGLPGGHRGAADLRDRDEGRDTLAERGALAHGEVLSETNTCIYIYIYIYTHTTFTTYSL